jgi:hypothetical protein
MLERYRAHGHGVAAGQVPLERPDGVCPVARAEVFPDVPKCSSRLKERRGTVLELRARINSLEQLPSQCIALLVRVRQAQQGVGAEGRGLRLVGQPLGHAPDLRAAGRDSQVQAVAIEGLSWPGLAAQGIGERICRQARLRLRLCLLPCLPESCGLLLGCVGYRGFSCGSAVREWLILLQTCGFARAIVGWRGPRLAEQAGFEPAEGYSPSHAFQACDLNRSSTAPMPGIVAAHHWLNAARLRVDLSCRKSGEVGRWRSDSRQSLAARDHLHGSLTVTRTYLSFKPAISPALRP